MTEDTRSVGEGRKTEIPFSVRFASFIFESSGT